jgi:phosphotransferase system enzyme I (PtsI)
MKTLKGISASPGITRGIAGFYSEKAEENIPHYIIAAKDVENEIRRLHEACGKAKDSLKSLSVSPDDLMKSNSVGEIIKAHGMILEDTVLLKHIEELIGKRFINAEHAVNDAFSEYIKKFGEKDLHFAELAHDIMDVRNRLLGSFSGMGGHFECPAGEREAVVVVSKRLTPSMVMHIPRENVLAFVTEEGGFTTHATILARGYGVPIVFGIDVEEEINCGDSLIVDGSLGKIMVQPDEDTARYYAEKIEKLKKRRAACDIRKNDAPQTKLGKRIKLKVNITTPGEMELVRGSSYDGVGLLRTEFLFVDKSSSPSFEEQLRMYRHIVERAEGHPVTIRLLDIGADKMPEYLMLPPQDNPDLGIRGARALSFLRDIYFTQMKAILASSVYGDVSVLYPMISDLGDMYSFREVLEDAKKQLKKEKIEFKSDLPEGVMIETPAAAVMSDLILKEVAFCNIGSNDLLQYTLAASRGSAFIEGRYHVMHPALVRLMGIVVKAGEKNGKEVCLCGEICSFEEFYPVLLGIGLASFSVSAAKHDDIKCHLLHEARPPRSLVKRFSSQVTKGEMDRFLNRI